MIIGNITKIGQGSKNYPEALTYIHKPPKELWYRGDINLTRMPLVSIVGTRKPTTYGKNVAYELGKFLSDNGVVVVSGMALGIDSYAHQGALAGKSKKTIAVLGSGINYIYPSSNKKLYEEIYLNDGLILSELGVDTKPMKYHFPLRNRIISGLSEIIVIIEAKEKSGSIITAKHGLEQGKSIYSVPGSIYSVQSLGTNNLISQGAIPLTNFNLILDELKMKNIFENQKENDIDLLGRIERDYNLNGSEKKILGFIVERGQVTFDEIVLETKVKTEEIVQVTMRFVMEELIVRLNLDTYAISKNIK